MKWSEWALSLAVFLPAVGAVIVMLIPRAYEELIKWITLLTTLATFGVVIGILSDFDYDHTRALQFQINNSWIDVINSRYHLGVDGISLPLLALSAFITVLVRHLLVEPLPGPVQPEGVPRAHPDPRSRHERHVRRPGPDPVLHLLRARAAPDVLHDRGVGRSEPRVRVDQVLPVHAVRLGDDAAELPRAVLQGRRPAERPRARSTASTWCCSRARPAAASPTASSS